MDKHIINPVTVKPYSDKVNDYHRKAKAAQDSLSSVRGYNVGSSDYATHKIQPWDIWLEYNLNPWDADIVKRVLRNKEGDARELDYEKIKHICDERLRQLRESK